MHRSLDEFEIQSDPTMCFTRPRYQVSVYRTIGPLVWITSDFSIRLMLFTSELQTPIFFLFVNENIKCGYSFSQLEHVEYFGTKIFRVCTSLLIWLYIIKRKQNQIIFLLNMAFISRVK